VHKRVKGGKDLRSIRPRYIVFFEGEPDEQRMKRRTTRETRGVQKREQKKRMMVEGMISASFRRGINACPGEGWTRTGIGKEVHQKRRPS